MAGKKKISYPITLDFKTGTPKYFNNAEDKYKLHKNQVDRVLNALNSSFKVGYVKRDRKFPHGINAHSVNDAIREKLKEIPDILGETNVVFGTYLPPVQGKGEFDFSVFDKISNYYNFWNYCYGKNAIRDSERVIDYYIRDEKTKNEWDLFIKTKKPKKFEEDLCVPEEDFYMLGEIQFGNWAMVYKDMFRLASAINKNAKIDLYIYITADGVLESLMSDGIVGFKSALGRFQENIDNRNITKPVMMIPLDLDLNIDKYDFTGAQQGYDEVLKSMESLEKRIERRKKKIKELRLEKKSLAGVELVKVNQKIATAEREKSKLIEELDVLKNLYKNISEVEEE